MAAWAALIVGLFGVVGWGRVDRATGRNRDMQGRQTIAFQPSLPAAVAAGEVPKAAAQAQEEDARLQLAEERTRAARDELAKVQAALEVAQRDLRQLKNETDAGGEQTRRDLDATRKDLERQREALESAVKAAEANAAAARNQAPQADDAQRQQRLRAVAAEGVARVRRRQELIDSKIRHDPRRLRDPALRPFEANQAAVAAAGAGGGGGSAVGNAPGATVEGDITRGLASMVAAQGEANLRNSQAAINLQTANAMGIDNRLRWTETYFEMRRVNQAARALEAGPLVTSDQAIQMAIMQRPPRLTSRDLDPVTGDITWPMALNDPVYSEPAKTIEECFQARAKSGGYVTFEQSELLENAIKDLVGQLKSNVAKYAAGKYGKARTFLDSLRQEFEMPLD
jgi:hypothetical protein